LVPAIQNQSNQEDCWTFATTTAMDSNLIQQGYLPTSTTAPPIALSSWYLSVYNGQPEDTSKNEWINWGGWTFQTTAFATRGQGTWNIPSPGTNNITTMSGGPVLVSNNPLNAFPLTAVNNEQNLAPYVPPSGQTVPFITQNAFYFDQVGSGRNASAQIDIVKNAVQTYGALATYMYAGGYTEGGHDVSVFNTVGNVTYEYNPGNKAYDHAVTIIGWNDNITVPGSGTTGAWIVQNSWGSWGGTLASNDGTFYAPYNDPYIGVVGVTAYKMAPIGKYSPFVLQNELGPTGNTNGANASNPTGMGIIDSSRATLALSQFTITSPGVLLALGLTSLDAQSGATKTATISLYDGFDAGTNTFGSLLETQQVTFLQEGYSLFDLNLPLTLYMNEMLAIKVDYGSSSIPYVWEPDGANSDLSFFYDTLTNQWVDFATFTPGGPNSNDAYDGVFSVKGILAAPEPSTYWLCNFLALAGVVGWRRRAKWRLSRV